VTDRKWTLSLLIQGSLSKNNEYQQKPNDGLTELTKLIPSLSCYRHLQNVLPGGMIELNCTDRSVDQLTSTIRPMLTICALCSFTTRSSSTYSTRHEYSTHYAHSPRAPPPLTPHFMNIHTRLIHRILLLHLQHTS